jgi:hypothetical protein
MEEVLYLYHLPYDPSCPLISFDERPCQLIGDVVVPIPMKEGQPKRVDYHYQRNGICHLFIAFEPHTGRRIVEIRDHRTKEDYAHFFRKLTACYPMADTIRVIQDNLNTHNPSSFYQSFTAQEAFALTRKFQMHYTPKHASWLNMVEIELSALSKQCLDRRIGDKATLESEVLAWVADRNQKQVTVNWQFSIDDARDKFSRFYPNSASVSVPSNLS